MVCGPVPGMLNTIMSWPILALAFSMARRSDPGPLLLVLVTVKVVCDEHGDAVVSAAARVTRRQLAGANMVCVASVVMGYPFVQDDGVR